MGREVRRVPKAFVHPTNASGEYIPLCDGFKKRVAEWDEENLKWSEGFVRDWSQLETAYKPRGENHTGDYGKYAGGRPVEADYMLPHCPDEERTHLMMYEDTTEGTPLSPPMPDAEGLAKYCADNGVSAFGGETATYDQWLKMIKVGRSVSAVYSPTTGLVSGVAGL